MTTTISTDEDIATLINVFTVEPDSQQQPVDLLDEATTQVIWHRPGTVTWATAKVEWTSQRGTGDRAQGRGRQAERGGDFNDAPPF